MKVIVQRIELSSTDINNIFNVFVLLDSQKCRFELTVEIDKIGDRELQRISTDRVFDNLFKYDIAIHSRICKLVSAVYNRESIDLPSDVGELEVDRDKPRPSDQYISATEAGFAAAMRLHDNNLTENLSIEEETSRQS
ncbi:hypothetical protein V0288_20015 [Pannus brasiliensis CCIBt3594]|uniref:Uncharacterized protein n=1 Tax=Pannus brasiliensis CCIBt3594 TaxID=1427578 RepID=A0AAW9QQT4_9CHRO